MRIIIRNFPQSIQFRLANLFGLQSMLLYVIQLVFIPYNLHDISPDIYIFRGLRTYILIWEKIYEIKFQHISTLWRISNKSWWKFPNCAKLKKVFIASNHSSYACPRIPGMAFALPEIKLFLISVSLLPSLPIAWFK